MLGLSLSKILFTILLLVAVWRAWKLIGPLLARFQAAPPPARTQARAAPGNQARPQAVDLVACPHCGTFVPRTTSCPSREGCRLRQA